MMKKHVLMSDLYNPYRGLYTVKELGKIRKFLKDELNRSFDMMEKKTRPPLYYLGYLFRNQRTERIAGRLGAITENRSKSKNTVFCDLRVGNYRYDNITNGGLGEGVENDDIVDLMVMPAELNEDAYRYALWKLTDTRYRDAAEEYYNKKSRELHYVDPNRKLYSKMKKTGETRWKPTTFVDIDRDFWMDYIRRAGDYIKKFNDIKSSGFDFTVHHSQQILVNSEGAEILQQSVIYELRGHLWLLTEKGEGITQEINLIEGDLKHLPDFNTFMAMVKERVELLYSLKDAPVLNSYQGPVLLSPAAAGLFFHEVVGHRLEGTRLLSPDDGTTFRDLRGKHIAPEFINIVDDPTMEETAGTRLIGHFLYDDEGTKAERSVLVEKGVLKNFLSTSAPIPGQKGNNGHARCQSREQPISRMANTIIENHNPINPEELRRIFMDEVRRQNKQYGIYIKDVLGGETDTSHYDFQAFKGEVILAYRVYPDGREEPVRGVDFVGTPLSALDSVIAMGDDVKVENSYCGAESGVIPVSTVSPSLLLSNLELQAGGDRDFYTQYAIPMPYEK